MQEDEGIEGVALAEGPRFVSALFVDPIDESDGSRIQERDRDRIIDRQQVIVCFWIDGERMSQGMVGCRWEKHVRHGSRRKSEQRWMGVSEVDGRCRAARWETAEHLAKLRIMWIAWFPVFSSGSLDSRNNQCTRAKLKKLNGRSNQ